MRLYCVSTGILVGIFFWPLAAGAGELALDSRPQVSSEHLLRQKFHVIQSALESSPYGEPIHIESVLTGDSSQGEVYAVLSHSYTALRTALSSPAHWCEILLLHLNVKACNAPQASKVTTEMDRSHIVLYVGQKRFQSLQQAYPMDYEFHVDMATERTLKIELRSVLGPMGTSDYRIALEAIPNDAQSSLMHFTYAYRYDWKMKLAVASYLATRGREKVGFSVIGYDGEQQPVYVKGVQGIIERNAMRYFLAIQSYLDTASLTQNQRLEQRISHWFDLTQRFERQLYELPRAEYIDMKRKEFARTPIP